MHDKPSVEPHNKIRVAGKTCYAHPEERWNRRCSLRDRGSEKGTLPCVRCVGSGEARIDRSCEGVLSSIDELTRLAVLPTHFLRSLINPTGRMA